MFWFPFQITDENNKEVREETDGNDEEHTYETKMQLRKTKSKEQRKDQIPRKARKSDSFVFKISR